MKPHEQMIQDVLKSLSDDGSKYVTGAEIVKHIAGSIDRPDLHREIDKLVKTFLRDFYPYASMYTALIGTVRANPGRRIEVSPSALQTTVEDVIFLPRGLVLQIHQVLSQCQGQDQSQGPSCLESLRLALPWLEDQS